MRNVAMLAAFGLVFSLTAAAQEAPGIAVGAQAPEMKGGEWVSKDGKAPDLKGKAYLADFWFEG